MWNKFFKKEQEIAARLEEEETRAAMKRADEGFAEWYAGLPDPLAGFHPATSKAAPGGSPVAWSRITPSTLPTTTTSAKFDFAAWEFNVACIKLAEKLGFTTTAEIYAFIKEIERD